MENAQDFFRQAGACERKGNMQEAIKLYKIAFKLDPEVDRKDRFTAKIPPTTETDTRADIDVEVEKSDDIETTPIIQKSALLLLPEEILVGIFKWTLYRNHAQFKSLSLLCKKISIIIKDPTIWRFQCEYWYYSRIPAILDLSKYSSYFEMFLVKPRIRTDGLYISKVTYLRSGLSLELSYMNPTHLVTYFRYIRFVSLDSFLICTTPSEPNRFVKVGFNNKNFRLGNKNDNIIKGSFEWLESDTLSLSWTRDTDTYVAVMKCTSKVAGRHDKLVWSTLV